MRLALALILVAGVAFAAPDTALKPYAGQIVLTPDAPPASFTELPAFLVHALARLGQTAQADPALTETGIRYPPRDSFLRPGWSVCLTP